MEPNEYETLAGRIDAVGRAVMHLAAALEIERLIDGRRLCQTWRRAVAPGAVGALAHSHQVLQEMAGRLDEARTARRAQGR